MYPLLVATKSQSPARRQAAYSVLECIRQHSAALVEQAQLVSGELIRMAILWHEMWHEGALRGRGGWAGRAVGGGGGRVGWWRTPGRERAWVGQRGGGLRVAARCRHAALPSAAALCARVRRLLPAPSPSLSARLA